MTVSWSTAADWDANQYSFGVHHESPAGTGWAPADVVEKGCATEGHWDGSSEVLFMPLAESSGDPNDISTIGGDNSGTITGSPTQGVTGPLGFNAFNFDGALPCRVEIPNSTSLSTGTTVAYAAWVKAISGATPASSWSHIAGKSNGGTGIDYGIGWAGSGDPDLFTRVNNSTLRTFVSWGASDGFLPGRPNPLDGRAVSSATDGRDLA